VVVVVMVVVRGGGVIHISSDTKVVVKMAFRSAHRKFH
jgi:hypothetical protein